MSKEDREKERIENADTGGHLGGTKFGQTPGTNDANPAKPSRQTDDGDKADDKK